MTEIPFDRPIPEGFEWLNPPTTFRAEPEEGFIEITTDPETDFWQRSHYGFRRDNGHCLLRRIEGEFSFSARFEFQSVNKYDQCGLMIRDDADNWVKVSIEREDDSIARLGSVATSLGYSDWATTDVSASVSAMSYRVSRKGNDLLVECSRDDFDWRQMRICHLHREPRSLLVGIYAASPTTGRFTCRVTKMALGSNEYFGDE